MFCWAAGSIEIFLFISVVNMEICEECTIGIEKLTHFCITVSIICKV